jgi:hypothetical protein
MVPLPELITGLIAATASMGAMLFFRRYGGATALAELERANRVLEKRVRELEELDGAHTLELKELRARTDIALAMTPIMDALELHEREVQKRSHATLTVLGLIADRLGVEE